MKALAELQVLSDDGERVLCRGWRSKGNPSARLAVLPVAEHPAPAILDRMAHEYGLREELENDWAVRPLELVRERDGTVLVLEDPGGQLLGCLVGAPMETGKMLLLAIGIAAALGKAHRRGLVHKDIKPANILVNSDNEVRLTGFGLASRMVRERQRPEPPESIAGTLAYMAPEQTGRMNRSIDSRSDLYALGVTLYEMLTGRLPFAASDPMEWVHCHIARQPPPPTERRQEVPGIISAVIMKLLAKTAEDRYQTAAGVEHDLRRCLAQWEADGRIDAFPLAEHDIPDRLVIPEKLYGRAREIETLLDSFERVMTSGAPELVLVAGYSGIGKSSVVNELHKVLVPPRGLFASGKFDQYKRDIPYATLAQAFQSLVRYLLGKSDAELGGWRDALLEALGSNGPLMIDLVPELKLIIGDQPPVPELAPQDARRRFQLVFRRFISVFARQEHPLALFLDDLQWLDAATLDLLEDLLTPPGVPHLMLIGAYRDNEVTAAHPLMRKLEAIRSAGANVQEITLAPLAAADVAQFIADALRSGSERAAPLAQLVKEKTAGNPFFMVQFLQTLAEEGWLAFDHEQTRWSWDLNRIHAKRYRDNIVDLMVGKLNRLPPDTQMALRQLACLGNAAPIRTLSLILAKSDEQVGADLWEAVRLELVEHLDGSYRFVHDRVQEAAYSLIPEEQREEAHLRIGRQLVAHTPPEQRDEAIFDIVNQFNRGTALIISRDEREQVTELNLLAGKRAKVSAAYASALKYLMAGAALQSADSWERRHAISFELELQRAECEFLTGALALSEDRLKLLSARAATTVERARVACLRVNVCTTLDQSERAVEVCLEYLAHLGVEWSPHPTHEQALEEYQRIWARLGAREIEDLIDVPLMSDPAMLGTLDVLNDVVPPALFTDRNLLSLVICRMVNLSLEHGNSDASCFAYVFLGMIAGPHFENYASGFQFGQLGYELADKRGLDRYQARTYMAFGNFVMPWTRHVRTGRDLVRRAFDIANNAGDLTFAAYSCNNLNTNLLAAGDALAGTQHEAERGLEFARKARFGLVIEIITAQLQLIRTLRGLTPTFGSFDGGQFDERRFEGHLASQRNLALPECWYWIRKLQARVLAGDYRSAIDAASKAQPLLWTSPSFFETAEYEFYGGLAQAGIFNSVPSEEQPYHRTVLSAHHRQLDIWATHGPENFGSRAALVGAEIARIEDRVLDAEQLYEKAIRSAREHGFVQNEGMAYELAARFYAARGFDDIAHLYLQRARQCYVRWGADGKVQQLDEQYPRLREEGPAPDSRATIGEPVERLGLATVLKVLQAVSGEIVLERLVETLLRTAIEQAGAERGLLILPHGNELLIQAEAKTHGSSVTVLLREAPVSVHELPESIIRYAARTQETVILDDASTRNPFSNDEYIREHRARSVLCLPLVKQGVLVALLYLENNLGPNFFAANRIAVLKVLAAQAAVSLDNSRLYRELQEREGRIQRLVDANIIGVLISDSKGEIIESNDAFLKMVGYTREELVSGRMRWRDMTPAEWKVASEQGVVQVESTGACKVFEKEYYRKDGSRVPVLVGAARFEKSSTVAFAIDLTELRRAEETLRRNQHYLAEAQKVSHTGSWAWSPVSNTILYWSEECYRISGYDPSQGLPSFESSFQRIHPEDQPVLAEMIERAVREKAEFQIEYRHVMPDGTRRNLRILSHPVLDASGRLVEFIGTVMDITEQKRAEEDRRAHLWFLESMDRINRAMQRTNDMEGMMSGVLEETRAIFESDRAWLVYPCDPDASTCRVVMEHTRPEYPGAFGLGEEFPVNTQAAEVLRSVLDGPGAVADMSVSPEIRERFSIQSSIAIAIRPKGDRPYLFGLHQCSHARDWTAAECRLFEEIARRLEDALTSVLALRNLLASRQALEMLSRDLQESKAKMEEAQRVARVGHWERDLATGCITWSDENYRIFGLEPQERPMDLPTLRQFIHPEDREPLSRAVDEALAGGARYNIEYRVLRPTGELRVVLSTGDVKRDESGRPYKMFGVVQDITDRKRAEEELRASEAKYRHLVDTTPAFVYTAMPNGEIDFCNRGWLEYLGSPLTDVLGWRWTAAFHPEDVERILNAWRASLESRQPFVGESRVRRADGEYRWFLHHGEPLRNEAGEIVKWYGSSIDIQERKIAERVMQRSEAYLAEAQRLSHTGSSAHNPATGKIHYWSEETYRIWGFDPQQPPPDAATLVKMMHPEDRDRVRELYFNAVRDGKDYEQDYRMIRTDGAIRNIQVFGHPVSSDGGELIEYVSTHIDVTERKRAEEAIRRSEAFLAEGQRLSHTGSWGWNASSGKLTWSQEHFRILGLDPQDTTPSLDAFWERVHPDDRATLRRAFESAIQKRRDFEHEFRIVTPDWSIRHVHGVGHAILNKANEFVEFIGSTMDITERKRAEERAQSHNVPVRLALNAFVEELDVDRFLEHMIAGLTKQFEAASSELWLFDGATQLASLYMACHQGKVIGAEAVGRKPGIPHVTWQSSNVGRIPKIIELPAQKSLLYPAHFEALKNQDIKTLVLVPLVLGEQSLGFIELHFQAATQLTPDDLDHAQALVHHATLALQLSRLAHRTEQMAVMEERNRMAREIHDTLAQAFAGVVLHSEALGISIGVSKSRSEKALFNIQKLARSGLEEARRSVQALRPRALEGSTLAQALAQEAKRVSTGGKLSCKFKQKGQAVNLSAEIQNELFRIAQEAMTNVSKHAQAKSAWITLEFKEHQAILTVRDNGIGIAVTDSPKPKGGYGLSTMRERAGRIGGRLEIESPARGGTTIRVVVPFDKKLQPSHHNP